MKAANAFGHRSLFLAQPEAGYIETMGNMGIYFSNAADIRDAVKLVASRGVFDAMQTEYKKADCEPYTLAGAARKYQQFFEGLFNESSHSV